MCGTDSKGKLMFRRDKRNLNNCPICGVFVCPGYQTRTHIPDDVNRHECDPEFIKRSNRTRDAVMDRDYDQHDRRSFGQRLSEGFEMLDEEPDDGED